MDIILYCLIFKFGRGVIYELLIYGPLIMCGMVSYPKVFPLCYCHMILSTPHVTYRYNQVIILRMSIKDISSILNRRTFLRNLSHLWNGKRFLRI